MSIVFNRTRFFSRYKEFFGPLSQSEVDGISLLLKTFESSVLPFAERHIAYMLATVFHETGQAMTPVVEHGKLSYFNKYNGRGGNSAPDDGFRYRGRGYVQLTFKDNYKHAGEKLSVDLVGHPDLALAADVAGKILTVGMWEGWFTGKSLQSCLPSSSQPDYFHARRIINGMDRAQLISDEAAKFETILRYSATIT